MKASTFYPPRHSCLRTSAIQPSFAADRVKTANGVLESTAAPKDGVRSFKGIPFGQPPVGRPSLARAPACQELERRPQRRPVRAAVHAADLARRGLLVPQQRHERGLPVPQRLDSREIGSRRNSPFWSTFSAAASRTATARSRATTARAWRAKAWSPYPSTTGPTFSASSSIPN